MNEMLRFRVELSPDEALALAQFIKRSTVDSCRASAFDDDEACLMRDALEKVGRGILRGRYRRAKPQ